MAQCEPRVSCIKIEEISKKISQVGLGQNVRERERREKKINLSPANSRGFASRNSADRELKLLYLMRATRGYWNHKILPRFGFSRKSRKGDVPGKHVN